MQKWFYGLKIPRHLPNLRLTHLCIAIIYIVENRNVNRTIIWQFFLCGERKSEIKRVEHLEFESIILSIYLFPIESPKIEFYFKYIIFIFSFTNFWLCSRARITSTSTFCKHFPVIKAFHSIPVCHHILLHKHRNI